MVQASGDADTDFPGTSLPQLFLAGFSWPRETIPKAVQAVGYNLSFRFRDRRTCSGRSVGSQHLGRSGGLAGTLVPNDHLFCTCVFSAYVVKPRERNGSWQTRGVIALGLVLVAAGRRAIGCGIRNPVRRHWRRARDRSSRCPGNRRPPREVEVHKGHLSTPAMFLPSCRPSN